MLTEPQVTQSVVRHFSRSQFRGFYTRREVRIQMGSYSGRADIVLYTDTSSPQMVVIVECKGEGIEGIKQLQSYLAASATELGIFANTDDPNQWHYLRNCGSNEFDDITRTDFENRVAELRPPPESLQRRDLMNDTKIRARTALFELKEAVLTVLLEAREAGEGPIEYEPIRQRLGIPRPENPIANTNSLIIGILDQLQTEGFVHFEANVGSEVTEEAASLLNES